MFPNAWYEIDRKYENMSVIYDFPQKLTMSDLSSKIVTGTRLRQLRVNKGDVTFSNIFINPFPPTLWLRSSTKRNC